MIFSDVVIIGSGLSGLVAGCNLQERGIQVCCFEKARGSGGRLSSKRLITKDNQNISFDLGCSSITANSDEFKQQIKQWIDAGVAKSWRKNSECEQYVGVPRNSTITRHLANKLNVNFGVEVVRTQKEGEFWVCYKKVDNEEVPLCFSKFLILAVPPEQAKNLLPDYHSLRDFLAYPKTLPQWVLMIATDSAERTALNFLEVRMNQGLNSKLISRVTLESSKPDRVVPSLTDVWQIQASTDWSQLKINSEPQDVFSSLINELERLTGTIIDVKEHYLHRWLYSIPKSEVSIISDGYILNDDGLGLCGDYLGHRPSSSGVEAAYLSGHYLGQSLIV